MASLFLNGVSDDLSTSINLGTPKVNAAGGKNIPIFNKIARAGLKVSTPMMLTWGANERDFDNSGKKSYDMSLQFPSAEYKTDDTTAFMENIKRLESYVKEQACINSKAWFGKVLSAEVVEAFWTPMLHYPKDKTSGDIDYTKSPTFRVKIPFWDGKFKCEVYNVQGEMIFPKDGLSILDVVPKGSEVKLILQCGGIWFAGGKFGITWKPYQMVVKPKFQLVAGVCHIPMNEQETTKKADTQVLVESDDEDPDKEYISLTETTDPEPPTDASEPEVPVKGKKKVVKKAAA
jgi:hypothetical protein